MIRDPSDGTIREAQEHQLKPLETQVDRLKSDDLNTGLREPSGRADYLARLDRSRKWLATYRTNPEKAVRETSDQTGEGGE